MLVISIAQFIEVFTYFDLRVPRRICISTVSTPFFLFVESFVPEMARIWRPLQVHQASPPAGAVHLCRAGRKSPWSMLLGQNHFFSLLENHLSSHIKSYYEFVYHFFHQFTCPKKDKPFSRWILTSKTSSGEDVRRPKGEQMRTSPWRNDEQMSIACYCGYPGSAAFFLMIILVLLVSMMFGCPWLSWFCLVIVGDFGLKLKKGRFRWDYFHIFLGFLSKKS